MNEWHYVKSGQRIGGVTEAAMLTLISQREVNADTLVWRAGLEGWVPLRDSSLTSHLPADNGPPVVPASKINQTWIWALAAAPLIGLVVEGLVAGISASNTYSMEQMIDSRKFWFIAIIVNLAASAMDERALRRAGVDTKAFGKLVFAVPVYMWRRADHLKQSKAYFWVWIVAFLIWALA